MMVVNFASLGFTAFTALISIPFLQIISILGEIYEFQTD